MKMYEHLSPICLLIILCLTYTEQQNDWQPIQPAIQRDIFGEINNGANFLDFPSKEYQQISADTQCEVYKVGFTQDLYFQYVQYKTEISDLKEFTLCFWTKFTNHSNDHSLFSYAVDGQPRAIYSWISNTERSSYFSLAVEGHTFYRLNYPLRLNKWYHTCQSWNGKTGEWQIWVNAERVGRGFHNRLVGSKIPGGGIAISGQEQTQLGGGFQEGEEAPKGSGGMLGEITMVQLYNVALTAGKAHKDHKHHHAHQYDHNGTPITTTPRPAPVPAPNLPSHPLLTSGQLNQRLRINLAGGQQAQPQSIPVPGQNYNAQYVNGQLVGNIVAQQLQSGKGPQAQYVQQSAYVQAQPAPQTGDLLLPLDGGSYSSQSLSFGDTPLIGASIVHSTRKRDIHQTEKREAGKTKREVILAGGTILDGSLGADEIFSQSLLDGLAGIGDNQPILKAQKQSDEREPAEAEVKAVMNICSGCDQEPFEKALVFGWRTVPKKLFSGAFYTPAIPQCRIF
ncbi:hypothetical protein WA026_003448 [Henosepilachna vigintioctopunctata]|uniref:Pentraxin (PTX) domain-containing protein n=1 Tax=Henosepilachna vigintioctopunctata TaxID=420089 RepID=A0AAW1TN45_9CUCU